MESFNHEIAFLYVSLGSVSELDTQLEIAGRVGLGTSPELRQLDTRSTTVSKMLHGLIRSVRTRHADFKASKRP